MHHEQLPEVHRIVTVAYADGEMELQVGQEFTMFGGDKWRIEAFTGQGIYSPSGLGGTPIIRCFYIGGEPISREDMQWVKENQIEFCADSVALAVSIQQKREAAQNPPTS